MHGSLGNAYWLMIVLGMVAGGLIIALRRHYHTRSGADAHPIPVQAQASGSSNRMYGNTPYRNRTLTTTPPRKRFGCNAGHF